MIMLKPTDCYHCNNVAWALKAAKVEFPYAVLDKLDSITMILDLLE